MKKSQHSKRAPVNVRESGDLDLTKKHVEAFEHAADIVWDAQAVLAAVAIAFRAQQTSVGPGAAYQRPAWTAIRAMVQRLGEIANDMTGGLDTFDLMQDEWKLRCGAVRQLFGAAHELIVFVTAFENESLSLELEQGPLDASRPLEVAHRLLEKAHEIASEPAADFEEHEHRRENARRAILVAEAAKAVH